MNSSRRIMFHLQNQVLYFLFFLLILSIGGIPSPNNCPVQVDFYNYNFATPNSPLSAPTTFKSPFTNVNTFATVVIIIITILNIILHKLLQLHESNLGTSQQLEEAKVGKKPSISSAFASEQLLRCFSLHVIIHATNNFDDSKVVGKGGFGKVYKGIIDDGAIIVAIKRLNHTSKQGAKEFLNEIELLSKFRHHNLISLIGYCNDDDEMIIIYEYMERGSLADHLYKIGNNNPALSWVQRLKICIGAARGLEYLHSGTNVIHRDMKSSNILLDQNLTARVSDFGISRVGPTNQLSSHVSTKIKGTRGYADPEYLMTRKLTKKSDVYSFGVVLFEVLSGRPVVDLTRPEEQWNLVFWAQQCIKEENIDKIADPNLSSHILPNSLDSFVKIANRCLHYRSKKRPTMAEVVASLESALALQERTDSSIFDNDLLFLGENFRNQEILNYASKQHEGQPKYKMSGDESSENSRTKTTRISAFLKTARKGFSNSRRKNKKSNDELIIFFGLGELKIASESFARKNKLGEGTFGPVYKGTLPGGQEIAIKTLAGRGPDNFKNEMILIPKIQHRNLVRMLGWCIEMGERFFIYEYVPNESLDSYLSDPVKKAQLDWRKRSSIIREIVRGIMFLHQENRIIHRNLKARSVLLDEDMKPKISGFGLVRVFEENQYELVTNEIVGTFEYMAPEYAIEGIYSVKSDVYSFGVLLLEIVNGKRNNRALSQEYGDLIEHAWKLWSGGKTEELIDPVIADSCTTDQVLQCVQVAMLCLQESAEHRPTMSDVMMMLESENTINFPLPMLPINVQNLLDPMPSNDLTAIELDGS